MKILNKKQWVSEENEVLIQESDFENKCGKTFEIKKYYHTLAQLKQLKEALEEILKTNET